MVTGVGSLEHQTMYPGDIADRPLGATTSKGYASDVPAYFRRGNSTDQCTGEVNGINRRISKVNGFRVLKLDSLQEEVTNPNRELPPPFYHPANKIEKKISLFK